MCVVPQCALRWKCNASTFPDGFIGLAGEVFQVQTPSVGAISLSMNCSGLWPFSVAPKISSGRNLQAKFQ